MKMSIAVLHLNDNWKFTWACYYQGKDRNILSEQEAKDRTWYPATVPGNVQEDLQKIGMLDDLFFSDNADHYRWCEEVDFWYRREIGPVDLPHGSRAILHFGGLDCFATIWIDGRKVGQHSNMFVPYWIDVTEYVRSDKPVELTIRLAANFQEVETSHRDPIDHPPMQRIRSRKPQISYGWDIGPRIVTNGLWRPVSLEIIDQGRILYAGARTLDVSEKSAKMEMVATVDWHARATTAKVVGRFGGTTVEANVDLAGGENDVVVPFEIKSPSLWWPNGMGEATLHNFELSLVGEKGKTLDTKKGRFGICKIEMLQEPRKDGGIGLRLKVNHRDYFAKGLNWTPSDSLFGRVTDDRIRKLVSMAADANVNMLRVWGGGVYEPESFLQACDEMGILIWQDFMFACTHYPQDPEFLQMVSYEATKVVRAYRGHVSMGVWSGDNEIDCCCKIEPGLMISRITIPEVLKKCDPARPYVPSSPYSPLGENPNDPKFGDCHVWCHTIKPDDPFYTGYHANFVSEIGRISLPNKKMIDAFIPKDKQWPVTSQPWFYHSSDTNNWRVYRNITHVLQCVKNNGYPEPKSLDELIEVTQKIQADAYKFWIEHYGSDPQCWGLLLWNLCDCWPQVSDAIVSYDLEPKKAYAAVKDAFGKLKR
jgi:beta-mannosidase